MHITGPAVERVSPVWRGTFQFFRRSIAAWPAAGRGAPSFRQPIAEAPRIRSRATRGTQVDETAQPAAGPSIRLTARPGWPRRAPAKLIAASPARPPHRMARIAASSLSACSGSRSAPWSSARRRLGRPGPLSAPPDKPAGVDGFARSGHRPLVALLDRRARRVRLGIQAALDLGWRACSLLSPLTCDTSGPAEEPKRR